MYHSNNISDGINFRHICNRYHLLIIGDEEKLSRKNIIVEKNVSIRIKRSRPI